MMVGTREALRTTTRPIKLPRGYEWKRCRNDKSRIAKRLTASAEAALIAQEGGKRAKKKIS